MEDRGHRDPYPSKLRGAWDLREAGKLNQIAGVAEPPNGAAAMQHDESASTCDPQAPPLQEDCSPEQTRTDEARERPPREGASKGLAKGSSRVTFDLDDNCGSISSTALVAALQTQRRVLRQSLEDALDAMELNLKLELQPQRQRGGGEVINGPLGNAYLSKTPALSKGLSFFFRYHGAHAARQAAVIGGYELYSISACGDR
eukprot:TRINITY_DN4923_c0_g4_i1.p1 TRINITY_DN4923_c0_g4~~TRINITY_DN4923_c0_g4_i1.p1  ORF type:complete len:202 (-),score=17.13 TRINITY_DN4923_c0_g4_i1:424-1029(-)